VWSTRFREPPRPTPFSCAGFPWHGTPNGDLELCVQVWKPKELDTLEDISLLPEDQLESLSESNQKVLAKSCLAGIAGLESVAGAMPFLHSPKIMTGMELQLWQAGST